MPHRFDPSPEDRSAARERDLDRSVLARDANPQAGEDERYGGRCGICGRERAAYPECPICDLQLELEAA